MYTRSAERSSASLKGTAEPLCLGWLALSFMACGSSTAGRCNPDVLPAVAAVTYPAVALSPRAPDLLMTGQ